MRSKRRVTDLIAVIVLIGSSWTIMATSYNGTSYGSYQATSDCVTPAVSLSISVTGNAITSPAATDYTTLGMPNATMNMGDENNGGVRTCKVTFDSDGGSISDEAYDHTRLYTCADNGLFVCTVLFKSHY